MKKLFEAHILKGIAFGVAFEKKQMQIAFLIIVMDVNFDVLLSDLKKFYKCLKEN